VYEQGLTVGKTPGSPGGSPPRSPNGRANGGGRWVAGASPGNSAASRRAVRDWLPVAVTIVDLTSVDITPGEQRTWQR
jgi:hypothetical protein